MNLRMRKLGHIVIVQLFLVAAIAVIPNFLGSGNAKACDLTSGCDVIGLGKIACERGEPLDNGMPDPQYYFGLSRKVLQYSHEFSAIIQKLNQGQVLTEEDWAPIESLVDTENWQRVGVFLGDQVEVMGWQEYKQIISLYGGYTSWTGTLRRISEVPDLVYLELEEHNSMGNTTNVSNTVTIYKFNDDGKLIQLDVYVAPVRIDVN